MNLTELQSELRSLETQIANLQSKVQEMKPTSHTQRRSDYDKITKLAKQYALDKPYLRRESAYLRKQYITCLSPFVALDGQVYDRLLYLTRLSLGLQLPYTAEEILHLGLNTELADLDWQFQDLKPLKYSLLTDILILANCSGCASEETLALAADYAVALGCNAEDMKITAQVAKAVLKNDFNILRVLPLPKLNCWQGVFRNHIPKAWLRSQRVLQKRLQNIEDLSEQDLTLDSMLQFYQIFSQPLRILSLPARGCLVKKDDTLAEYTYGASGEIQTVTATKSGIAYFEEGEGASNDEKYIDIFVCHWMDWFD